MIPETKYINLSTLSTNKVHNAQKGSKLEISTWNSR